MLENNSVEVLEERPARKKPLGDDEAQALLTEVDQVRIAKGRKVLDKAAAEASTDDLKGPTGNYRAPIVRCGRRLLVGWNAEALEELLR